MNLQPDQIFAVKVIARLFFLLGFVAGVLLDSWWMLLFAFILFIFLTFWDVFKDVKKGTEQWRDW